MAATSRVSAVDTGSATSGAGEHDISSVLVSSATDIDLALGRGVVTGRVSPSEAMTSSNDGSQDGPNLLRNQLKRESRALRRARIRLAALRKAERTGEAYVTPPSIRAKSEKRKAQREKAAVSELVAWWVAKGLSRAQVVST